MKGGAAGIAARRRRWLAAWPEALEQWSRFTQLREPLLLESDKEGQPYGMAGQIAAIRLVDQLVMVNLAQVGNRKLVPHALAVLAHEIGHHIYVPGNLTDNGRLLAAIGASLSDLRPDTAPFVANLYGDLLINDRLQRAGVDVAAVYRALKAAEPDGGATQVWMVYTRAYEHLWRLPFETLSPAGVTKEMNVDAALVARLIRHYAAEWLRGARRFATVLYPYLRADQESSREQTFRVHGLDDTKGAGRGRGGDESEAIPDGLSAIDPAELDEGDELDAEMDAELGGSGKRDASERKVEEIPTGTSQGSRGQFREPFQYGELLKALGLNLSAHEITTRYYRERALPYLIPFPVRKAPRTMEPVAEGFTSWEAGEPLDALDVMGSLLQSPEVIPGVTTVQRVYGEAPGSDPARTPLDLDIYVDSSGSMPDPAYSISYLALAGAILALSALRAGARVQATLWSGPKQFETTRGFIRDEKRILGVITGSLRGSTAFPLHILRETYKDRKADDPPAHIVVISDEGVDTMLAHDEKNRPGEGVVAQAMKAARGGGTLALNLFRAWPMTAQFEKLGFRVHAVRQWEDLIAFARAFVQENYEK